MSGIKQMNSSSETMTSGTFANHTGNALERFVEHTLKEHGYTEFINHKKQVFSMRNTIGGKQYSKQPYIGQSIYDTERNSLLSFVELLPFQLVIIPFFFL